MLRSVELQIALVIYLIKISKSLYTRFYFLFVGICYFVFTTSFLFLFDGWVGRLFQVIIEFVKLLLKPVKNILPINM